MPTVSKGKTERDLLEQEFEFLRDDANDSGNNDPAKEIAKKYYETLFREFALIDLSRWREGQVALRWRTKQEILQGLGQFTCASLTCPRHAAAPTKESIDEFRLDDTRANNKSEEGEDVGLETFEMNFGYVEKGVKKNALVKVCVCEKCAGKLRRVKEGRKDDRRERRRSRDRRDSRDRRHRRHRDESEEHASRTRRRRDLEKEKISDHGGVEDSGESARRHKSGSRHHRSDRRSRKDESERHHRSNHQRTSRSRSPSHGPT